VLVGGELLVLARHRVSFEEQELRAQEADAFGAVLDRGRDVVGGADVGGDLDPAPVAGDSRLGSGGAGAPSCLLACGGASPVLAGELCVWLDVDGPTVSVEEQLGALGNAQQPVAEPD